MDSTQSESWSLWTYVLGAPASGKGTLCKRLSQTFNLYHLSVGDYLRQIRHDPGHELIKEHLSRRGQSQLLPGSLLAQLLQQKIEQESKVGAERFLIDGFPRNLEQFREFRNAPESPMSAGGLVIMFDCPKDACRERFLNRNYEDRAMDDAEMFEFRYEEFKTNNPGILQEFEKSAGFRIIEFDTSGHPDTSWQRLYDLLIIKGLARQPVLPDKDSI